MNEKTTMKYGDLVEWTSQSGGYKKTKRGFIVAVVPPFCMAHRFVPIDYRKGAFNWGMHRNHESYIVKVSGRGIPTKLYWPRVAYLKLVKEEGNPL